VSNAYVIGLGFYVHQPIPLGTKLAYLVVVQPVEGVKVSAGPAVNVLD
jgi:hypothetical protein